LLSGVYRKERDNRPAGSKGTRFHLGENIPDCKLSPSFSVESFYELNNPDGNQFDKFRFTLAVDYKINKSNSISVFSVYNNKPTDDENTGKYILGIGYKFTIK
jgi:hypothetical protein